MILICATIYDTAAEAYMRPFFVPAVGQAMRAFSDEINNPQSELHKHPEDYSIWHMGTYNDVTGEMVSSEKPVHLASAVALIKVSE